MKTTLFAAVTVAVLALVASAGATTTPTTMALTCHVAPGMTRVTNITDDKSHFRFQWWYASGTTWKAPVWVYYAASRSNGTVYIPTHGHPVRAMATMHRRDGHLVRVTAACTK